MKLIALWQMFARLDTLNELATYAASCSSHLRTDCGSTAKAFNVYIAETDSTKKA